MLPLYVPLVLFFLLGGRVDVVNGSWASVFAPDEDRFSSPKPPEHSYSCFLVYGEEAAKRIAAQLEERKEGGYGGSDASHSREIPVVRLSVPGRKAESTKTWKEGERALEKVDRKRRSRSWGPLIPQVDDVFVRKNTTEEPLLSDGYMDSVCLKARTYMWGIVEDLEGSSARVKLSASVKEGSSTFWSQESSSRRVIFSNAAIPSLSTSPKPVFAGQTVAVVCLDKGSAPVILPRSRDVLKALPQGDWILPVTIRNPRVVRTTTYGAPEIRGSVVAQPDLIQLLRERMRTKTDGSKDEELTFDSKLDILAELAADAASTLSGGRDALRLPAGWVPSTSYAVSISIGDSETEANNLLRVVLARTALEERSCLLISRKNEGKELLCPGLERLKAFVEAVVTSGFFGTSAMSSWDFSAVAFVLRYFRVLRETMDFFTLIQAGVAVERLEESGVRREPEHGQVVKVQREFQKEITKKLLLKSEIFSVESPRESHVSVYLVLPKSEAGGW